MKIGRFVVLASADGAEPWRPVPPEQHPEFIRDPETLGRISTGGEMIQNGEGGEWYRAERIAESVLVLPKEANLRHKPKALEAVKPH